MKKHIRCGVIFALWAVVCIAEWNRIARIPEWLGMNSYYRLTYGTVWAILFFATVFLMVASFVALDAFSARTRLWWKSLLWGALFGLGAVNVLLLFSIAPATLLYFFWIFIGMIVARAFIFVLE